MEAAHKPLPCLTPMATVTASAPSSSTPPKTQAQLIMEQQRRARRAFTTNVSLSWVALLLILFFLFSGLELSSNGSQTTLAIPKQDRVLLTLPFSIPGLNVTTIGLDWDFIQSWAPFISEGVWQTIGISALSILFATLLALL